MSKRKKKIFPSSTKSAAPVESEITAPAVSVQPFNCPAISVVIPLYNAEKYIAECLESFLAQTFKNFEVIIAIVDSFIPKFGERLKFINMKKDGAGIPRNAGITLARGEYIRFVDPDDRITETALEEDFTLAKKYNADVVYHTLFYKLSADGKQSELAAVPKYRPGDEIVLDEDLPTRVVELARNKYYHNPWFSFSRRDFLIANELYFPNIFSNEDIVWNYALLIYAEKFLRVPSAVYFYRDNAKSTSRKEKTAAQNANFYFGLKSLDSFISRHKFFETEPQLHYALLETYFNGRVKSLFKDHSELSSSALYETLRKEFGENSGDYDVLIPALFTALAQQQKLAAINLNQFKQYAAHAEQKILELENEINRRKNKQ